MERYFSRKSEYLPLILNLQLAFLAGLVVVSFVLPLSGTERGVLIPAAGVLAGLNRALMGQVRRR